MSLYVYGHICGAQAAAWDQRNAKSRTPDGYSGSHSKIGSLIPALGDILYVHRYTYTYINIRRFAVWRLLEYVCIYIYRYVPTYRRENLKERFDGMEQGGERGEGGQRGEEAARVPGAAIDETRHLPLPLPLREPEERKGVLEGSV